MKTSKSRGFRIWKTKGTFVLCCVGKSGAGGEEEEDAMRSITPNLSHPLDTHGPGYLCLAPAPPASPVLIPPIPLALGLGGF